MRQSDLSMNGKHGCFCNVTNWHRIKRELLMKRFHQSWRGGPHKKIPPCSTLETNDKTPIFIPVDITEDVAESVAQIILGGLSPGGTDVEDIQGWILKFREDSKRLCTSVETFFDWLSNGRLPWLAYCAFMSGYLIAVDKHPAVHPVRVG